MMRIGSLCSGIGGLGLGLQAVVGGTVAWHAENDPHPSKVLAERFPGVPTYGDLTATDWTQVEPIDWITAGYPCQPFSHAGKRKGSNDERHIWPFVARAVGVLRPRCVLLENVAGHVSLGLDAVLADLAALGYDATWGVIRAADAGACHGRARVFIVAAERGHGIATDSERSRRAGRTLDARRREVGRTAPAGGGEDAATDADGRGREVGPQLNGSAPQAAADRNPRRGHADRRRDTAWGTYEPAIRRWEHATGRPAPRPTEPGRTGERLSPRFVEWMQGYPEGWVTDLLTRNAALKALGNSVVPQQCALAVATLLGLTSAAAS